MKASTVTISKSKYRKLKQKAEVNIEFLRDFEKSLQDIKAGRVIRVR